MATCIKEGRKSPNFPNHAPPGVDAKRERRKRRAERSPSLSFSIERKEKGERGPNPHYPCQGFQGGREDRQRLGHIINYLSFLLVGKKGRKEKEKGTLSSIFSN